MPPRLPVLATSRLTIRPFALGDLEAIHRILDVELAEADFGSEGAATLQQRRAWLEWTIANYAQLERLYQPPYGDRAVALRETGEVIGACGYVPSFAPFRQLPALAAPLAPARVHCQPELGLFYAISPAHQQRSYAAEAAAALIEFAFAELDAARVVATTTYDNTASIRVMEKIGMRIERNPFPDPPWFQLAGVIENPRPA